MKKIVFIFFILPVIINAQVYKAGTQYSNYIDITPDTLINYTLSASPLESYGIDINGDSQNDFALRASAGGGMAAGNISITINPLNTNSYTRFGRYDSIYNNYQQDWWVTKISKPLLLGDTINSSSAKWDSLDLDITDNSYYTGTYKNIPDWVGTSDLFIGLKYKDAISTIYGWIRVNVPSQDKCNLKDYSFSVCNSCVGIREYAVNTINVYPNPVSDKLFIENKNIFENSDIEITNALGQIVLKIPYSNSINVTQLASGFYTLKIIAQNKEAYYSKFVKD